MSSVSATVKNGEIVTTASQSSLSTAKNEASSGMDKDAFLQLLVAQMKYQDPLEPTSNTEYISQYAQFSQVEALNNMSTTMELSRYSSYVGKEVVIETEGSNGKTTQVRGFVDYVTFEEGKAYFSIDGNLYKASDMVSAISNEYSNAEEMAKEFAQTIKDLPAVDSINIRDHGNTIAGLQTAYDNMSSYERKFLDDDDVSTMNKYVERLNVLLLAAAEAAQKEAELKAAVEAEAAEEEAAETVTPASETSSDNSESSETAEAGTSEGAETVEAPEGE